LKINDLEFSVDNVNLVTPKGGEQPYLTVDFEIYNATETRKFDLPENLKFVFSDEFGNNYSRIKLSNDKPSKSAPAPSFYPKETRTTRLAFEMPVGKATKATLEFDGSSLGITDPVRIPMALPQNNNSPSITIVAPENGVIVERGTLVHLHVTVAGPRPPDDIIVDAFDYTYEDHASSINNVYDLNIPGDFAIGPQNISVIAKWKGNTAENGITSSDSIILHVRDASSVDNL
jgi:hypothetical protein